MSGTIEGDVVSTKETKVVKFTHDEVLEIVRLHAIQVHKRRSGKPFVDVRVTDDGARFEGCTCSVTIEMNHTSRD